MTSIGVLGTQGDVAQNVSASREALGESGTVSTVWSSSEIERVDGLIIPGGESTVIGPLSELNGAMRAIQRRVESDSMPVLGICAGLVLIARNSHDKVLGESNTQLGLVDIDVERNSFGRQRKSFEANVSMPGLGIDYLNGVFIRAPTISRAGDNVTILARVDKKIIAVKQGSLIGVAFHPELAGAELHRVFIKMITDTH